MLSALYRGGPGFETWQGREFIQKISMNRFDLELRILKNSTLCYFTVILVDVDVGELYDDFAVMTSREGISVPLGTG